jgi:phenylpyruvate tautomerase PptA (4-oxalocrotonate tautomerase family)
MPLVRIMLAEGRSPAFKRAIADQVHEALVSAAAVPKDDRFQTVHEVPEAQFIWDPGYLGIRRTKAVVFIQIFLNEGRSVEVKKALYSKIAANLGKDPGLGSEDILVNLVEVKKENWSFGGGVMSYPPQ